MFGKRFFNNFIFIGMSFLLLFSQSASAHLVSTGAGPFYDGTAHFFMTFEEILPVLALSLFAGLRGPRYARWVILALPLGWIIGAFAAFQIPKIPSPPEVISIIAMLIPGALLASDWNLPFKTVIAISAFFGLLLGFFNGTSIPEENILVIIGSVTAALIVAVLSAALAIVLNHGWKRIAIRVAGSWLTALGLLALGWSLRSQ